MSEERWATLSDLYGVMRQTFQDDYHRAALLTRALKTQLSKALGCPRDNIPLFDYDEATFEYVPEDDAFRAVSMNNDYVWFVGFGVTLEQTPNSYLKCIIEKTGMLLHNVRPSRGHHGSDGVRGARERSHIDKPLPA
jgi:hypothetical protein